MPCGSPVHLAPLAGIGDTVQIDYKALSKYSLSVSPKLKDALSLSLIVRRRIMCAEKVTKYNVCSLICVLLYTSLVPRLSWEGKESLVMTACACANPYQQNLVSCFSLEEDIAIGWRWCLDDFNKVTRAYIDLGLFE